MFAAAVTRSPTRVRHGAAALLLLALLAVLAAAGWARLTRNGVFPNIDFHTYYKGGALVRLGLARDLLYPAPPPGTSPVRFMFVYDPDGVAVINRRLAPALAVPELTYGGFAYPPTMAILAAPLTLLPVEPAGWAWRAFLLIATLAGLAALGRVLERRFGTERRTTMLILFALIVTWPFVYGLRMGQASLLVFATVALALDALVRGRLGLAGVAIGVGALIKVIPIVLIVLLWRPRLRPALMAALLTVAAGAALSALVVPLPTVARYFAALGPSMPQAAASLNNQSLLGLFVHLALGPDDWRRLANDATVLPGAVRLAASVAAAALMAAVVWMCARPGRRRVDEAPDSRALLLDLAALSAVAVLITPLSWPHSFAAAFPAFALALAEISRRHGAGVWIALAGLQALWLVAPTGLPDGLARVPAGRLLVHPTLFAAAAVIWLVSSDARRAIRSGAAR